MWALSAKLLSLIMGLVISALITRILSPSVVGTYFLSLTVVTAASLVGRLGLDKAVLQHVATSLGRGDTGRARRTVRGVLLLGLVGALGVGLVLGGGFTRWLAHQVFHAPGMAEVNLVLVAWAVLLTFQGILSETFRGFHDIRGASLVGGAITALLTGGLLAILGVVSGESSLRAVVGVTVVAVAANSLFALVLLRRKLVRLPATPGSGPSGSQLMAGAVPLLVSNATMYAMSHTDLWIVGGALSEQDVAIYGAAARLVMLLGVSLAIANQVLPPVIGELWVKRQKDRLQDLLQGSAALAMAPALLLYLVFVLAGGRVLGLVFGPFYSHGAWVLILLSVGQLVNVWVGGCGYTLVMAGFERDLMWTALLGIVLAVTGGLLVVHRYGIEGVAVATSGAVAVQQLSIMFAVRFRCGLWTFARPRSLLRLASSLQ